MQYRTLQQGAAWSASMHPRVSHYDPNKTGSDAASTPLITEAVKRILTGDVTFFRLYCSSKFVIAVHPTR